MTVVGDAMARPLAAAIERGTADISSLAVVANGGALLTPTAKQRLIDVKPGLIVVDGVGSSETGAQMTHMSAPGAVSTGKFNAGPDTFVAAEDLSSILEPGHDGIGWLAQRGYVPLGYKGDAAKTAATFPVIDGVRYSVPGDRARHLADGAIELLGRDSVTINSGGEKIFVEEVETAIASHPAVADVVVSGRPSERWGQEVVAIVALVDGASVDAQELIDHAAGVHRPLQAAQGGGVPAGHRAQPGGQGRLPVGPRAGDQRRRLSRRRVRLRAMRSAALAPTRVDPLNGGAARPVMRERQVGAHHGPVVAERVEAGLAVVGAHAAAADPAERGGRRNHLSPKVIARDAAAAGVTDEAPEVVVVGPVPVRHQRCGPLVDVVDDIRQRRIRPDHQNRSEDLFVGDSHVLVDVTHDRGRDLASGPVGQRFPRGRDGLDRRTVGPGVVDEPDDPVEVGLVDRRAVVVVGDDRREHAAQCLARGVDERCRRGRRARKHSRGRRIPVRR